MKFIFLALSAPPALAFAFHDAVLVESAPRTPDGWEIVGPSPRSTTLELSFAIKQRNVEKLHDELMAVSDPRSPRYGKHLSNEQVHALTAPTPSSINAVRSFLAAHSPRFETLSGDIMSAVVSVKDAEAFLGAKYFEVRHTATGVTAHRIVSGAYTLPAAVAEAVDFVSPTVHLPGVRINKAKEELKAPSANYNIPPTLRELYSIGDALGKAPTNKMAVTAFLGQKYSESALNSFWSKYCTAITCGKGLPKLIGDATTGTPGVESMLDIETITGMAGNVESEFWGFAGSSPDNPQNEPFMKWLTAMSNTSDADIPKVFSTSYGEDEASWSLPAAKRLNIEFMKAGARGISLLYASGDEGANCKQGKFVPEGPGSSPYVTAVGGTGPTSGFPKPGSEEAVSLSSGGFSDYWAMPSWQTAAVEAYLSSGAAIPAASFGYNVSGRAYPDISAQAVNFCVTPFGCGVAGTSCATPTASGVFSLLNDLRLQAGRATLGFLNPMIYQNAAAFNDVTEGSNSGCGFSKGWPAAVGWDAVTGVGTPNYAKLSAVVSALP